MEEDIIYLESGRSTDETDTKEDRTMSSSSSDSSSSSSVEIDMEYPGTALDRMMNARNRIVQLHSTGELNGRWEEVRKLLLWAGGLKDIVDTIPGFGYTGHCFQDFNHVDLTCILPSVFDNDNADQVVGGGEDGSSGVVSYNPVGVSIRRASLPEIGYGGSWTFCALGCHVTPEPADVAHVQFESRIAFKLVWVPNARYDSFVIIDDDGNYLAHGQPSDGPAGLPEYQERMLNYRMVSKSKYGRIAEAFARNASNE